MRKREMVLDLTRVSLPTDVEGYKELAEIALDMRWSWHHYSDKIWRRLD